MGDPDLEYDPRIRGDDVSSKDLSLLGKLSGDVRIGDVSCGIVLWLLS